MAWVYLFFAGVMEIIWAIGLKYTEGFTKLYPSLFTVVSVALSFSFLATSLRTIPIGTAYAVWVGIGAVGVALIGIVYFEESKDIPKLICLGMILAGIIGLKLVSEH